MPFSWTVQTFSPLLGVTRRVGLLSGGERWVAWKPREAPGQPRLPDSGVSGRGWASLAQSANIPWCHLPRWPCSLTVTQ